MKFAGSRANQYQTNTPVVPSFYARFWFYLFEKYGLCHKMTLSKLWFEQIETNYYNV